MGAWKMQLSGLLMLCMVHTAYSACSRRLDMAIDTTANGRLSAFSGCYNESSHAGLYETVVYTVDGEDLKEGGSPAILAHEMPSSNNQPLWVIATVLTDPVNTWTEGLTIVELVCVGNTTFWETKDPTEVEVWECDTNGDGQYTSGENGDFGGVTCGCSTPQVVDNDQPTPAPVVSVVGPSTNAPVAPTPVDGRDPTPTPVAVEARTSVPVSSENPGGTPSPSRTAGVVEEAARRCNITLESDTLEDVVGCYVGQASVNGRGRWDEIEGGARIEWQASSQVWVIAAADPIGGFEVIRCLSSVDVEDPTTIGAEYWICNVNGATFTAEERGDNFKGLQCVEEACHPDIISASDGSGSENSRNVIVVVSSVLGSALLLGLLIFAVALTRRTMAVGPKATSPEPTGVGSPSTSETPTVEIPVFQPWGTRDPPKFHG